MTLVRERGRKLPDKQGPLRRNKGVSDLAKVIPSPSPIVVIDNRQHSYEQKFTAQNLKSQGRKDLRRIAIQGRIESRS